jgi:hypothetical protein
MGCAIPMRNTEDLEHCVVPKRLLPAVDRIGLAIHAA